MNEITAPQRALHAFLFAYHPEGLAAAQEVALPAAATADLHSLISAGLVEMRFVPIARDEDTPVAAVAAVPTPSPGARHARKSKTPKATRTKTAPTPRVEKRPRSAPRPAEKPAADRPAAGWTDDRKAAFIAALRPGAGIAAANVAVGLKADSVAAYSVKRADPAFAEQWDEAKRAPAKPNTAEPPVASPSQGATETPPRQRAPAAAVAVAGGAHNVPPAWCEQCEQRVTALQAKACTSRFCKAKAVADGAGS